MFKLSKSITTTLILILTAAILGGCAGTRQADMSDVELRLAEREQQVSDLETAINSKDAEIRDLEKRTLSAEEARESAYESMERMKSSDENRSTDLLPPASVGECYTRVFVPAEYESITERVLKKQETSVVEVVPAEYEWVEEKILVKDASSRLEEVPAQYEWVEEQVQIKEAHTVWKEGRGLIEKVDNATGEIMCLVEIPAEYRTVRKLVEVHAAATREVAIPAEYKTVQVKKLVRPAQEKRTKVPAEYQTFTRYLKLSEGLMAWKQVLCETNMSGLTVQKIQQALLDAGHSPGPIDGVIGLQTHGAIKSYQKAKGLPVGGLTYETIASLGIKKS